MPDGICIYCGKILKCISWNVCAQCAKDNDLDESYNSIIEKVENAKGELSMKLKIGQEMEITQDFEIEAELSGKKMLIKKGDKGFVDSRGRIHYTSGNAIGKIQLLKDSEVKGYDTENIAEMIFNRLKRVFYIDEFLDGYDISKDDFINEIDDVLMDIL